MKLNQKNIDILRSKLVPKQSNFIGNKDFTPLSEKVLEVISPIDGKVFSTIAASETEDVDHAVTFARKTFNSGVWANMPPKERKVILLKWADLIEINALRIAVLGVRDNGTEIKMAIKGEPKTAADVIRFYAEAIDKINGEITPTSHEVLSLIQKEPVGVVGIILPWNFPLMVGAWKIAPALAAVNSVVLKPS